MAQTKKQPKRSVTMWLDGPTIDWLEARVKSREAVTRTHAATEALDESRVFRERLEEAGRWEEFRALSLRAAGPTGELLGATAAGVVLEALEKRGRK